MINFKEDFDISLSELTLFRQKLEEQKAVAMFLLRPLSVLVILLSLTAEVHSVKPPDGRVSSRRYYPRLREQAIMMMSKRGGSPFSVRWYLKKKHPQPPVPLPSVWCLTKFSKTIARARRHICPDPSRIDEPRKKPASFGISYGRG